MKTVAVTFGHFEVILHFTKKKYSFKNDLIPMCEIEKRVISPLLVKLYEKARTIIDVLHLID